MDRMGIKKGEIEKMNKEFQFLVYSSEEENININVKVKNETIWLTQKAMGELFDVKVPAISKHLNNIYEEGELERNSTISKIEIVQKEGNGNISRTQMEKKVEDEYKKYSANTLTQVEKDYLSTIKNIRKIIKKNKK